MERRADQGRLRVQLSFVISLVRNILLLRGEGTFHLSFFKGGWGPDYDRLGRYWCQGKGHIYKQLPPLPWPFGPHVAG